MLGKNNLTFQNGQWNVILFSARSLKTSLWSYSGSRIFEGDELLEVTCSFVAAGDSHVWVPTCRCLWEWQC